MLAAAFQQPSLKYVQELFSLMSISSFKCAGELQEVRISCLNLIFIAAIGVLYLAVSIQTICWQKV
jgi:hypothetical protein